MKLHLVEKVIKLKYLSNLILKSNKVFTLYSLYTPFKVNKNTSLNYKQFKCSTSFLKILLNSNNKLKWNWLFLFKGVINVLIKITYNASLIAIQNTLKDLFVLGAFIRNFFFSAKSLKWFFFEKIAFAVDLNQARFGVILTFIKNILYLSVLNIILVFNIFKKFFFKLETICLL